MANRFLSGEDQSIGLAGEIEGLVLEEFGDAPFFDNLSLSLSLYRPGGGDHLDDEAALASELGAAVAFLDVLEQPPSDTYELIRRLRFERVRERCLSIGEPFDEGTYCLEKGEQGWSVFTVRNGDRVDLLTFEQEGAACREFLVRVLDDSATRPLGGPAP
jgi:hypothetical protein